MAIPLKIQLFDSFLGTQEGIHSIILPDIFSSGGSKNLFIDKYGRAKKISGYAKQNSSAVTTNTGASAALVRGLFPYRGTGGGSTTRQLISVFDDGTNEWEIWKSTDDGATNTFVSDLGSTSVGKVPDFAQFGDNLYITNGVIAPRKWDGTTLSTTGRTQSPTVSSAAGSAGTLSGHYRWKLVSLIGDSRKAASVASTSLSLQSEQGSLTWTADADGTVTGYEIYRTSGTGEVFYFVDYVDGRTTAAYTDNKSDLLILENRVMQEHGDPPSTGVYFCEPHKQRMWWARTDTYPTRAYWSDPGLAEDVLLENFLDFSDSETVGDVITGMLGNKDGKLVVWTEKAVWTVSGTGQIIGNIVDWTKTRTNCQVGSVSHRTAVRVPAGAKYSDQEGQVQTTNVVTIAYLTPLNDIRIFDGDNDIIISTPVKTTLSTLNHAFRHKAFAINDIKRGEIVWLYPAGSSGEPSTAVVWNYRWGVWYQREWAFSSGVQMDTASDASVVVTGSNSTTTGGYIYLQWSGNSFDGTAIEAIWLTKTLFGTNEQGQPAMTNQKRFRWADLLFETEQTVELTVEWLRGNAPDDAAGESSRTASPAAANLLTSDGDTILTSDGDTIVVSQQSTNILVKLKDSNGHFIHDTGLRLRVSDNASLGSWSLEAMNLAYQIFPGLNRRMQ